MEIKEFPQRFPWWTQLKRCRQKAFVVRESLLPPELDDVSPWRKAFCDDFEAFLPRLLPWTKEDFLVVKAYTIEADVWLLAFYLHLLNQHLGGFNLFGMNSQRLNSRISLVV
ncbi:hypothetical protein CJ030_MR3G009476 [Morella rubra]|uniref:Uncharacterized protein n=1 Tax=Morella rubra TaxID=262757 RepID=A0A6A1W3M4_9ROSI|nr:hypothetical protein CJ030_MR3G009476 [Morella rubra]